LPKSSGREELSVLIGLEVLIEGIAFDSHDLRKLPYRPAFVTKVLKSLRQEGILERVNTRKYLFRDEFVNAVKEEIMAKVPRNGLMQFPTTTVFDMCGVESWTEREMEGFLIRFREHWKKAAENRGHATGYSTSVFQGVA
jgi:hypothetical protein